MYSDTHFHLKHLIKDKNIDGSNLLRELIKRETFFLLDIGTSADDLAEREKIALGCIDCLDDKLKQNAFNMLYFSAGIWPSPEEIKNRFERIKVLENEIISFKNHEMFKDKICAIGECGLDHHWNILGVDNRNQDDFDKDMLKGEKELFELQIELAKNNDLPVIVHSRDAFEDTYDCIKNMGYNKGVIHCYSYGKKEASAFLDLGWYIAFGGGVTYTKKSKIDEMCELLRYIPNDLLLMETDSPYLTPVPYRGNVNTPILIEYCYDYVAKARGITSELLSELVDNNIKRLFK